MSELHLMAGSAAITALFALVLLGVGFIAGVTSTLRFLASPKSAGLGYRLLAHEEVRRDE